MLQNNFIIGFAFGIGISVIAMLIFYWLFEKYFDGI